MSKKKLKHVKISAEIIKAIDKGDISNVEILGLLESVKFGYMFGHLGAKK